MARGGRARTLRGAFADETYWARPLPGLWRSGGAACSWWASLPPRTAEIGPAALFTGDESGNFLFRALHAVGLVEPSRIAARGRRAAAVGRAADGGLPLRAAAQPPHARGVRALPRVPRARARSGARAARPRGASGRSPSSSACRALALREAAVSRRGPAFAHGARVEIGPHVLYASYHPSQQNTFTGKADAARCCGTSCGGRRGRRRGSRLARPDIRRRRSRAGSARDDLARGRAPREVTS